MHFPRPGPQMHKSRAGRRGYWGFGLVGEDGKFEGCRKGGVERMEGVTVVRPISDVQAVQSKRLKQTSFLLCRWLGRTST